MSTHDDLRAALHTADSALRRLYRAAVACSDDAPTVEQSEPFENLAYQASKLEARLTDALAQVRPHLTPAETA